MERNNPEIEKTLKSLDDLKEVHLSQFMAQRIYQRAIHEEMGATESSDHVWSWVIGVAAVLLINFGVLYWTRSANQIETTEPNAAAAYFDNGLSY